MKNIRRLGLFVVGLLAATNLSMGQEPRGSIAGQILDPNGSVIAGAKVTITNTETAQTLRLTSNEAGSYTAPLLGIGRYSLEVENPGFKRVVKENVEVRVSDRLQIDIAMEVGAVSESVVVAEATPLLQTAEASLGQLIDSRRVDELPIAHGNPFHLI